MSIYQWPLLFMTRRQICESTEQDSIERKVAFNICCPLTIIKYTLKKKKHHCLHAGKRGYAKRLTSVCGAEPAPRCELPFLKTL